MCYIRFSHRIALLAGTFAALAAVTPAISGCNSGDFGNTSMLNSPDCRAIADVDFATAVGAGARASVKSVAFGASAGAPGTRATALGYFSGSNVNWNGATMVGYGASAHHYATALGADAGAIGDYSIAIGGSDDFPNNPSPKAVGYRSIAIGQRSTTGDGSGFTGFGLGDFGTSIGFNNDTAFAATAVGTDAQAKGDSSTALGRFANSSALSAVALGHGAVASRARSVALGSGSLANVADTVSVGTTTARRRIVNLAHGVGNTDAATLGQVKAIATAAAETAMLSNNDNTDIRRELADLRAAVRRQEALVQRQQELLAQQQQELAGLKGQKSAALAE